MKGRAVSSILVIAALGAGACGGRGGPERVTSIPGREAFTPTPRSLPTREIQSTLAGLTFSPELSRLMTQEDAQVIESAYFDYSLNYQTVVSQNVGVIERQSPDPDNPFFFEAQSGHIGINLSELRERAGENEGLLRHVMLEAMTHAQKPEVVNVFAGAPVVLEDGRQIIGSDGFIVVILPAGSENLEDRVGIADIEVAASQVLARFIDPSFTPRSARNENWRDLMTQIINEYMDGDPKALAKLVQTRDLLGFIGTFRGKEIFVEDLTQTIDWFNRVSDGEDVEVIMEEIMDVFGEPLPDTSGSGLIYQPFQQVLSFEDVFGTSLLIASANDTVYLTT